jgi:hypothetical protein
MASAKLIPCVHIGLPKAASTFFQKNLFPFHSQVDYLGKFIDSKNKYRDAETQSVVESITRPIAATVPLEPARKRFERIAALAETSGRVIVWSSEGLTAGAPPNREQRALDFRTVFGPCRILIILREPVSFVGSMYLQKIREGQTRRLRYRRTLRRYWEVEEWLDECWEKGPVGPLSNLDYAGTIDIFSKVFGKDAVGVFCLEQLSLDPESFVRSLCRFVGIDEEEALGLCRMRRSNTRLQQGQLDRIRRVYRSFWLGMAFTLLPTRYVRRYFKLRQKEPSQPGAVVDIPAPWRLRIQDFTRPGNRRLVAERGLPLEAFGYPL